MNRKINILHTLLLVSKNQTELNVVTTGIIIDMCSFFGGDEGSCRAASGKMSTRTFYFSSFSTRSFQAKKFAPLCGALFFGGDEGS